MSSLKMSTKMSKSKLKSNISDKPHKKRKLSDLNDTKKVSPPKTNDLLQSSDDDQEEDSTIANDYQSKKSTKHSATKTNSIINTTWAESFAKILNETKPKNKKTIILSKSKKIDEIVAEKQNEIGFEIDGEIKEEKKPDKDELIAAAEVLEKKTKRNKKLELRLKPMQMDRERERLFNKIATKGVVQLFNAVRAQQKDLHRKLDEVGSLDHKRDAVLNNINKKKFLDVLMGGARAKSENVDNPVKDEIKMEEDEEDDDREYTDGPAKQSQWSVLRDDFMTDKKMSNWDKDENEDDDDDDDNESEDESDDE